jgi:hypothetical protein
VYVVYSVKKSHLRRSSTEHLFSKRQAKEFFYTDQRTSKNPGIRPAEQCEADTAEVNGRNTGQRRGEASVLLQQEEPLAIIKEATRRNMECQFAWERR